jgi:hypothetical protein
MDAETTILDGVIEEELYINQGRGLEMHGKDTHVCRLKKAFYGL